MSRDLSSAQQTRNQDVERQHVNRQPGEGPAGDDPAMESSAGKGQDEIREVLSEMVEAEVSSDEETREALQSVMRTWNQRSELERERFRGLFNAEAEVEATDGVCMHEPKEGFDFTAYWTVEGQGCLLPLRRRRVKELALWVAEQIEEWNQTEAFIGERLCVLLHPEAPIPACGSVDISVEMGVEAYHVGMRVNQIEAERNGQTAKVKSLHGRGTDTRPLEMRTVTGVEVLTIKTYRPEPVRKIMASVADYGSRSDTAFERWVEENPTLPASDIDIPGAWWCRPIGGWWTIETHRLHEERQR